MAIDIDKIKKRKAALENRGGGRENFWRPTDGEHTLRIVPTADGDPFRDFWFHYNVGDNPGFLSPKKNFGEDDAIDNFVRKLFNEGTEESIKMAKSLMARQRFFSPVLVRGEEDKGVRFWEFGKMVYQELLGVMMDEDYGDITDIAQGRDVTVEVIPAAETGKMYDTTTVRVKPVQTPLSDSAETIESFLENQKNVVDLFNKYSFDEMKESLQKYLAPSEEQETVEATTPAKEKVDLDSKIDDLFG